MKFYRSDKTKERTLRLGVASCGKVGKYMEELMEDES